MRFATRSVMIASVLTLALVVSTAGAQQRCDTDVGTQDAARWTVPLDRRVTLREGSLTLRSALDYISRSAGVTLTYASDLLPLDAEVCGTFANVPLGEALRVVLRGVSVQAVPSGPGRIVLTPIERVQPQTTQVLPTVSHTMASLERVTITEHASRRDDRDPTTSAAVIEGADLVQGGVGTVGGAVTGGVPGIWVWPHSPASLSTRYASVRGASSFGHSQPKVYIDGIEVANALLFSRFAPEAIARIEVIRGPQGAALYGANAISGVINIATRQDGANAAGYPVSFRSDLGVAGSAYSALGVLSQSHSVSAGTGPGRMHSASGVLSLNSVGEFVPGGASRELLANGSFRRVGKHRGALFGV